MSRCVDALEHLFASEVVGAAEIADDARDALEGGAG
jgi:hypothetical protein